jgi:hypothetical protein
VVGTFLFVNPERFVISWWTAAGSPCLGAALQTGHGQGRAAVRVEVTPLIGAGIFIIGYTLHLRKFYGPPLDDDGVRK